MIKAQYVKTGYQVYFLLYDLFTTHSATNSSERCIYWSRVNEKLILMVFVSVIYPTFSLENSYKEEIPHFLSSLPTVPS